MLSLRQTRRMLWLTAATGLVGGAAVLAVGLNRPYLVPMDGGRGRSAVAPMSEDVLTSLDLTLREPAWRLSLHRPLYDPPPVVVAMPPAPPPPPLKLRLLGTVLEPDNTQAIVMTGGGEIQFHRVGDTIEGATLQSIEQTKITVSYHDETRTLEVQQ